jgi:MFS family permease
MTQALRTSLRESPKARWTAMCLAGVAMLCGYFMADVMAPLKPMLEQHLHWTSTQYGFFTSAYGWFNVFLFMLLIGGIILDKMGVRFTGLMSTLLMVAGAVLKYYAITNTFDPKPILQNLPLIGGMPLQVYLAGIGYAIFGVGVEVAGITTTKLIVKWFKGKEMALAMGLQLAMARMGTALALMISAPVAAHFKSVGAPVLLAVVLLIIGFISYLVYGVMDKKLDASEAKIESDNDEPFRLSDIKLILKNKGFWYISMLCLLFYSAVFPFLKYATDLMVQKYHVALGLAGIIPGLLPFGNIFMTPICHTPAQPLACRLCTDACSRRGFFPGPFRHVAISAQTDSRETAGNSLCPDILHPELGPDGRAAADRLDTGPLLYCFTHCGCRWVGRDRLQLHYSHAGFHGLWYPGSYLCLLVKGRR